MTTFEMMFQEFYQSEAERELREWLKRNEERLKDESPAEVAYLAIFCGFDKDVVYSVVSSDQPRQRGQHPDSRAAQEAYRFESALEEVDRLKKTDPFDLKDHWKEIIEYSQEGIEFKEAL